MKVAVTGGSGQLGGLILRRLIDDRAVKRVLSLDLRPPALVNGKLESREVDVCDPGIAAHFEGCDAVFHLAFIVTRRATRAEMDAVNVGGSRNVFAAAARQGVRKLLYASSVAAYGAFPDHPVPITEETPRRLQDDFAYAANKFAVEAELDAFEPTQPAMQISRFRPSVLIGLRIQNPLGRLFEQCLSWGYYPDPGAGAAPLPLVWDEDVADAMMLALKRDVRGAFNVSADDPVSPAELAAAAGLELVRIPRSVLAGIGRAAPVLERLHLAEAIDPAWQRQTSVRMVVDSTRARRLLGWNPRCATAVDVIRRFVEVSPGRPSARLQAFFRLIGLLSHLPVEDETARGTNARVHLALTGRGGGDFGLIAEEGRVRVLHEIPRPPTSVVTMPASLWLEVLAGRASVSTAQLTGKVKLEGDPLAVFLLGGLAARYRQLREMEGLPGAAARRFTRWMEKGANP